MINWKTDVKCEHKKCAKLLHITYPYTPQEFRPPPPPVNFVKINITSDVRLKIDKKWRTHVRFHKTCFICQPTTKSTCNYNSQLNYMINEYKIQGYYIINTFKGRNDVIKIILYPGIWRLHVLNCTEWGQGQGHICRTLRSKHWLETDTI